MFLLVQYLLESLLSTSLLAIHLSMFENCIAIISKCFLGHIL